MKRIVIIALLIMLLATGCVPRSTWVSSGAPTVDFSHYPTSEAVTVYLNNLASRFPQLVDYEVVGESIQGKPIPALTITNSSLGNHCDKPALFILAQQHAREPISSQVVLGWIESLLGSYGENEVITHLLDTRTVYVLPQANPDGNDIFLTNDQNLRSNLRPSDLDMDGVDDEDPREGLGINSYSKRLIYLKSAWIVGGEPFRDGWNASLDSKLTNAHFDRFVSWVDVRGKKIKQLDNDGDGKINEDYYHGVDINRNWDIAWLEGDARVNSYTYKGTAPWSEPETRAIRDFVLVRPNIVAALDLHSGVNKILYPWSMTAEPPPDEELLRNLARAGSALVGAPHTRAGDGLYICYGTAKDWLYSKGIAAITAEVYGASPVVGYQRLWPSYLYLAYFSTAERFNPPPQLIGEVTQKWGPYLDYLLAIIPNYSLTSATALDNDNIMIQFTNTGYLTPNSTILSADDTVIEAQAQLGPSIYELPLGDGDCITLTLEFGSLLAVADRTLPRASYRIRRSGDEVIVEEGTTYCGPSPSTLFDFAYEAPADPWGQEPWYITSQGSE